MDQNKKVDPPQTQKTQEALQSLWSSLQRASEVFTDECTLWEEEGKIIALFKVILPLNPVSKKWATQYIKEFLEQEGLKAQKVEWGPGYLRLLVSSA
jgi:hypothetical protein